MFPWERFRHQLKSVLSKTETKRQSDLIRLPMTCRRLPQKLHLLYLTWEMRRISPRRYSQVVVSMTPFHAENPQYMRSCVLASYVPKMVLRFLLAFKIVLTCLLAIVATATARVRVIPIVSLSVSPSSGVAIGQTVQITATVLNPSSFSFLPIAGGAWSIYDNGTMISPLQVASNDPVGITLSSLPLAAGAHSFSAVFYYTPDATYNSNTVELSVAHTTQLATKQTVVASTPDIL
jgi:hypothetical protein